MLSRPSFRFRLIRWYTISLLTILLVFGVSLHVLIRNHLYAQQDLEMEEEAQEVSEALLYSSNDFQKNFDWYFSQHGRFSFQVEKPDGVILSGSPWLRAHRLPHYDWEKPQQYQSTTQVVSFGHLGKHRIMNHPLRTSSGPLLVRVIVANSQVERNIWGFTQIVLLAGSVALVAAFWGGSTITRQAMRPLEQIIRDAERISAENLNEQVTVQNPNDELGRLAITLNRTFTRLRKSIHQMSRFTADAAHELRTPLAALRMECDVALTSEQDLPSLKRSMTLALEEIDRLSHIVNQLLSLSRIDSGVETLNLDSVFLKPLIKDVVELLNRSAQSKGVRIDVDEIPDCQVLGDDVALSRLFFNLIDNSIKYTPSRGQITISGKETDGLVEVSVTDSGIGIDQRDWEHLFDRFYRVDSSRTKSTGGAGLGLAICKAIADAHHAKLSVESVVGQGSTFTVAFRIINHSEVDEQAGEPANELQNSALF